jgi:hypothetical protein
LLIAAVHRSSSATRRPTAESELIVMHPSRHAIACLASGAFLSIVACTTINNFTENPPTGSSTGAGGGQAQSSSQSQGSSDAQTSSQVQSSAQAQSSSSGAGGGALETHCDKVGPEVAFCDDFSGTELDTSKWWYGRRHWGPAPPLNDGVVPENVSIHDGRAFFAANGDKYSGTTAGIRKDKVNGKTVYIQDQPGTRSGGIIISDAYLGSGKYEARMKLPANTGVCSAMWSFHYQEIYQNDPNYQMYVDQGNVPQGDAANGFFVIPNHEIDIEVPTSLMGEPDAKASYENARYTTWIGETDPEFSTKFLDVGQNYSDGVFHVFRYDWHSGGGGMAPRVDFYVDDVLKYTSTSHIPWIKGRLTIGTWFPQWAGGTADFDVQNLELDWFSFSPFGEANDKSVPETYPDDGATKCHDKASNDANLPKCEIKAY